MKNNLCVIGSSNIDHVIKVSDFPRPGQTITGLAYQQVYGGKGANQAIAAIKAGGKVTFISALGDDSAGQTMHRYFAKLRLNVEAVKTIAGKATGLAMIQVSDSGENSIVVVAGANQYLDKLAIIAQSHHIREADMMLIQLETPLDGVEAAVDIAYQVGKKVILNPAPAQPLPDDLLQKLWLITPNETEAEALTGITVDSEKHADAACQALREKGVAQVIITMGKRGVYYQSATEKGMYPAFVVPTVDTTAAGDTFNGALASALLGGDDIQDAIRFAQAASALSVQKTGAQTSIPDKEAILTFLKQV